MYVYRKHFIQKKIYYFVPCPHRYDDMRRGNGRGKINLIFSGIVSSLRTTEKDTTSKQKN